MPYGDRRGPFGEGPRSGRGLGYCSGYDSPGYLRTGRSFLGGRCSGFFGRGRGWRNMFYATGLPGWARFNNTSWKGIIAQNEEDFLRSQVSFLEEQLKSAKMRLDELKSEKEEK